MHHIVQLYISPRDASDGVCSSSFIRKRLLFLQTQRLIYTTNSHTHIAIKRYVYVNSGYSLVRNSSHILVNDMGVLRPAPPLPTKAYTTLVPKFEKHPFFADFGRKKNPPLFQPKSLILRASKTPVFKQNAIFS